MRIGVVKNFIIILAVFGLSACATVDERFANPVDVKHPGMQVFLDYQKAINSESKFDDEKKAFFSEQARMKIATTMGWHRLVYTASFRALKSGSCDEISILSETANRILVSCKGPYSYVSAFGFGSDERMHLRVNVRKNKMGWYIDTSGLTHTMGNGKSVSRSLGLKFPK